MSVNAVNKESEKSKGTGEGKRNGEGGKMQQLNIIDKARKKYQRKKALYLLQK